MRPSSFPPKLQKFVKSVEKHAQSAGISDSRARIYGAWSACFVRYCTVNDRSWRKPNNVTVFLDYLTAEKEVGESSRERVAESLTFLFEELLETDVSGEAWHPDQQEEEEEEEPAQQQQTAEEEGEQSKLLTRLLFHTSLPISEAMELCAGDVDLESELIYVSDAMGTPKQIVELPDELYEPLREHLQQIRKKHGPRYYDAPLFQARALKGRVDDSTDDDDEKEDDSDSLPSEESTERPATLWG